MLHRYTTEFYSAIKNEIFKKMEGNGEYYTRLGNLNSEK